MIPALELKDAITIVTGIIMVTAVILGQKYSTSQLRRGQGELLRQVQAVHRRMDDFGKRLTRTERNQAVLRERVKNIRDTNRFKVPDREVPMFKDDG